MVMSDATITHVKAREILDSRGNPTVEARVTTSSGAFGTFAVPSGASTGSYEDLELRDEDSKRFGGKGVLKAVRAVNHEIANTIVGMDATEQRQIDTAMIALDGTENESRLGANAILAVSIAAAKAAAAAKGVQVYEHLQDLIHIKPSRKVPYLYMNLINGGLHASSRLAFQEYLIVPQTPVVTEALNIGTTIMHGLKKSIQEKYGPISANIGDEGGFVPDIENVSEPLELLMEVAKKAGLSDMIKLGMDVAASSFFEDGKYRIADSLHDAEHMKLLYEKQLQDFPIQSIEDPFGEDNYDDFASLKTDAIVVGDDLTVTNKTRLKRAIDMKAIGGIVIKINQIGSLWEALETMELARKHDIELFVKHRSGETNDDFIADLAFAYGAYALMAGAPQRGERVAKYNRLWEIVNS